MEKDSHISRGQLADYANHYIDDQSIIDKIKEHLDGCELCQKKLAEISGSFNFIDSWTAKSHGEAAKTAKNPEETGKKIKKALSGLP